MRGTAGGIGGIAVFGRDAVEFTADRRGRIGGTQAVLRDLDQFAMGIE